MKKRFIKLSTLIEIFKLKVLYLAKDSKEVLISAYKTNKPGLNFVGFYKNFEVNSIQIIGETEMLYLKEISYTERFLILTKLFKKEIPLVIIDINKKEDKICNEIIRVAKIYKTSLLKTTKSDYMFTSYLECFLNEQLVLNSSVHGVFVEVFGEGVLITGRSGIGKTELAVELIKRGHKLIADDKVHIIRVGFNKLKARAFSNIRNFIEIKGIGIVNVEKTYGVQVLKLSENVDFMVELKENLKFKNKYLENYKNKVWQILGVEIPKYVIQVNSYCNLPLKVEFLAMKNKHKKIGYDSQKQFFKTVNRNDIFKK